MKQKIPAVWALAFFFLTTACQTASDDESGATDSDTTGTDTSTDDTLDSLSDTTGDGAEAETASDTHGNTHSGDDSASPATSDSASDSETVSGEDSDTFDQEGDTGTQADANTASAIDTDSTTSEHSGPDTVMDSDTRSASDADSSTHTEAVMPVVVLNLLNDLALTLTGPQSITEETIPEDVNRGAYWGMQTIVCEDGGYDVAAFANQVITRTIAHINGECSGMPIRISVMSTADAIVCAYLCVHEDSSAAPGIWPINDASCRF